MKKKITDKQIQKAFESLKTYHRATTCSFFVYDVLVKELGARVQYIDFEADDYPNIAFRGIVIGEAPYSTYIFPDKNLK